MSPDEPVLKSDLQELKDFMIEQMNTITKEITSVDQHMEGVERRVSTLIGRVQQLEIVSPKRTTTKKMTMMIWMTLSTVPMV
jgi:phage shock protein A